MTVNKIDFNFFCKAMPASNCYFAVHAPSYLVEVYSVN